MIPCSRLVDAAGLGSCELATLSLHREVAGEISEGTSLPQTQQLWAAFRTCYATEELAVKAALRNTGTILPSRDAKLSQTFGICLESYQQGSKFSTGARSVSQTLTCSS